MTTTTTSTTRSGDELPSTSRESEAMPPATPDPKANAAPKKKRRRNADDPRVRINKEAYAIFKQQCAEMETPMVDAISALITKAEFPPPRIELVERPAQTDVVFIRDVSACATLLRQMCTALSRMEASGASDANVLKNLQSVLLGVSEVFDYVSFEGIPRLTNPSL